MLARITPYASVVDVAGGGTRPASSFDGEPPPKKPPVKRSMARSVMRAVCDTLLPPPWGMGSRWVSRAAIVAQCLVARRVQRRHRWLLQVKGPSFRQKPLVEQEKGRGANSFLHRRPLDFLYCVDDGERGAALSAGFPSQNSSSAGGFFVCINAPYFPTESGSSRRRSPTSGRQRSAFGIGRALATKRLKRTGSRI